MSLEPPPLATPYKDRKTGLNVFGALLIALGAFIALSTLFTVLAFMLSSLRPQIAMTIDRRTLLMSLGTNGAIATGLVTLGIGSIRARRWARALCLCLGWIGVIFGVFGLISISFSMPVFDETLRQSFAQQGQEMPPFMPVVMKVMMVATSVLFYILIPLALILFYRSENVRLTCAARDPVPRWTDRCPVPVLAVVLLQLFGALSMLIILPIYGGVFPLFGTIVNGAIAYAIYVVLLAIHIYAARGFYLRQIKAYWVYFGLAVVGAVNGLLLLSRGQLIVVYEQMGFPEKQLKQMETMLPLFQSTGFLLLSVTSIAALLGYLLWLRRFFVTAQPE